MKRLTAPWTAVLATAALLALPAAGGAQTPQTQTPPEPQPEQSTTLSTPTEQDASPAKHLQQAKDALANIDVNTVPASAKSQLASLRRHISALERSVAANDRASATGAERRSPDATSKPRGKTDWSEDVAAIDRIITQLAGSESAAMTGTGDPGTAGTSGAKSRGEPKSSAEVMLDESTRNQLLEVRTHITEFAAAMSGTSSSPPRSSEQPSAEQPSEPEPSAPEPSAPEPSTPEPSAPEPSTPEPTAPEPSTPEPSAPEVSTPEPSALEPGQAEAAAQPGAQENVDSEAAKLHLTAARDSLTQLTQLPAAAQLQGDARTQVSQLIQNFNELITTQENWPDAYAKVEANLNALIGPAPEQSSDPAATAPPTEIPETTPTEPPPTEPPAPPATQPTTPTAGTQPGTPGAVGTSGTMGIAELDPGIRQKLVEFRTHLLAFHRAAAGDQQ